MFFAEYVENNLESGELIEFEAFWNDVREMWNGRRVRRARMTRGHYVSKGVIRAVGSDGRMRHFDYDRRSLQRDGFYYQALLDGRVAPDTPVVFFLERDSSGDERMRLLCVMEQGGLKKFYDHKNCGFLFWSQSKEEDKYSDPFFWCSYSGVEAVRQYFAADIPFHFAPVKTARGRPQALYCYAEAVGTVSTISLKEEYLELSWSPPKSSGSTSIANTATTTTTINTSYQPMTIRIDLDDLPDEIELHGVRIGDQIRFDYFFARAIVVIKEIMVQGKADGFPNQRALRLILEAAPSVVVYDESVIEGEFEILTGDKLEVTLLCLPPEMCNRVVVKNVKAIIDAKDIRKRNRKKLVAEASNVSKQQETIQTHQSQKQQQQQSQQVKQKKSQQRTQLTKQQPQQNLAPAGQLQHQFADHQSHLQSQIFQSFSSLSMSQGSSPALGTIDSQERPSSALLEPQQYVGQEIRQKSPLLDFSSYNQQLPPPPPPQDMPIASLLGNSKNDFFSAWQSFISGDSLGTQPPQHSQLHHVYEQQDSGASNGLRVQQGAQSQQFVAHRQIVNHTKTLLNSPQPDDDGAHRHHQQLYHHHQQQSGSLPNIAVQVKKFNMPVDLKISSVPINGQIFKGQLLEQGIVTTVAVKSVPKESVADKQKFRTEMLLLTNLKDADCMVKIKCVREDDDYFHIAMEYCENMLERVIDSLGDSEKLRLVNELIQAVAFCHSRQLMHRSIKPANIWLTSNRNLKLLDDGVSRAIKTTELSANDKMRNWRAIENIFEGRFEFASDIFSLGLVIFYILSGGKHPYQMPNLNSLDFVEANIMNGYPQTFTIEQERLERHFPGSSGLIHEMLHMDYKKRPSIENVRRYPLAWPASQRVRFLEQLTKLCTNDRMLAEKINRPLRQHSSSAKHIQLPWTKGYSWFDHLPEKVKRELNVRLNNANGVAEVTHRFSTAGHLSTHYNVYDCVELARFIHETNGHSIFNHPGQNIVGELLKSFPNLVHYTYLLLLEHQRELHSLLIGVDKVIGISVNGTVVHDDGADIRNSSEQSFLANDTNFPLNVTGSNHALSYPYHSTTGRGNIHNFSS